MKEQIQVMISEEEVNARISEIAAQISEDFKGEEILVIGILRGGVYFLYRADKEDYGAGNFGLYGSVQLWGGHGVKRAGAYYKRPD